MRFGPTTFNGELRAVVPEMFAPRRWKKKQLRRGAVCFGGSVSAPPHAVHEKHILLCVQSQHQY